MEKKIKYVPMFGSPNKAKADEDQFTDGAFPCLIGGFLNPFTKESRMLHLPGVKLYNISGKMESIKEDLGNKLEIYICGGGKNTHSSDSYNLHIQNERDYFESTIKEYFPNSKITVEWNNDDMASKLYIDKERAKFIKTETPAKIPKIH